MIVLFLPFFYPTNSVVFAQDQSQEQVQSDDVVRRVRFSGNRFVKDRTLENLVRTKTNREFLGVPGFTPWYFFHRVSKGSFGEAPALLDRDVVAADMERIVLYYQSLGYREVQVDTTIVEYRTDRIEVSFIIREGTPSRIETVTYSGFPLYNEQDRRRRFFIQSPITGLGLNDSTFRVNRQFNAQELKDEQLRIINFLRNNGYAAAERDSVIAYVRPDSADSYSLHVLYRVDPGNIYRFGDIQVKLADPYPPDNYTDRREIDGVHRDTDTLKTVLMIEPDTDTKLSLLSDQLLFKPGELYNEELYLETVKEFQNLGNLYIRRFGQAENGVRPDFSKPVIPTYFDLETYTKHNISTEFFGMKRYGFGTGIGVDYTNNNVFGKAEQLVIGANASFEFVSSSTLEDIAPDTTQSSFFRSYELRTEYSVPRISWPFSFLDNQRFFTNGITRYTLAYSRSDQLLFDINSDVRFNYRYEVQHNNRLSSFLDLIELDIIDTNPSDEYTQSLIDKFGENSFEYIRLLQDFEPQISSIIRYTIRSQRTDLIKKDHGYFSEYSIAAAGNIPYAIDRFIVTPGTVEGDLPALFKLSDNELTYSRFFALTADYRRYYPLSNSSVFAWRLFGGFAHPYGKNTSIPLNRRFFAGGSNDIRGYAPFQLGPGSINSDDITINGGEIKLLAQTEARQTFVRDLLSANWIASWFVDAGNVWYGPRNDFRDQDNTDQLEQGRFTIDNFYNQLAVSSGLGLRLDWEYVVVRFDFAFRANDLDVGWFNNKKMYFSFGIGHSF
ncbi:MAG: BamA/TamA family outer membrane protein [Balneolaceae bacterium]|nr:BamA/TamA family outer membrane protein [Balneolaceae bacterium]